MSFLTKTIKDALAKVNAMPVWRKPVPQYEGSLEGWRAACLEAQHLLAETRERYEELVLAAQAREKSLFESLKAVDAKLDATQQERDRWARRARKAEAPDRRYR